MLEEEKKLKDGKTMRYRKSNGLIEKWIYDKFGRLIKYENNFGDIKKIRYNKRGWKIYELKKGLLGEYWEKRKFNKKGRLKLWTNSKGFYKKYRYYRGGHFLEYYLGGCIIKEKYNKKIDKITFFERRDPHTNDLLYLYKNE